MNIGDQILPYYRIYFNSLFKGFNPAVNNLFEMHQHLMQRMVQIPVQAVNHYANQFANHFVQANYAYNEDMDLSSSSDEVEG